MYGTFGLSEGEFDVLATLRRAGAPFERTPKGRELIDKAFAAHVANERGLLDEALSPSDAAALEQVLTTWLAIYES
ncbi:hypothetical protein [Agromyces bauzanensis]|uniref:MarR family transcriptional regulator n=1 Tax=Agromyces bauzanensis TaxID=1308924 RepID=A0A917P8V6_9MICO|nr:hypothetical protein [Agromyces bauzanensis]GGJ67033.1 hypothetical protein GCM10011372_01010 [Agromyces bauzanensis]